MNGQGSLELMWRARWVAAACLLHICILGPVLFMRPGPKPISVQAVVPIDIIEIAAVELPAAEAVTPIPDTEAMPEPAPVPENEIEAPEVSVPEIKRAPPSAPTVILNQPATQPSVQPARPPRPVTPQNTFGGGSVGSAEQLALRSIFCRDMTDWQREDAGCDALEAAREQYAPLYEATPLPDYERIQRQQSAALAATMGESYVEGFMKRNAGIPAKFFDGQSGSILPDNNPSAIDNSIFMPRRPAGQGALDRINNDQRPDWEDEIRRAHGTD